MEANCAWVPWWLWRMEEHVELSGWMEAPECTKSPREYFQRNCWAAVEGSEPEIQATATLIGADRMCISTDYPHFDSNFPNVTSNLLANVPREIAARILYGGAGLYGFTEKQFQKADAAAAKEKREGVAAAMQALQDRFQGELHTTAQTLSQRAHGGADHQRPRLIPTGDVAAKPGA